MLRKAKTPVKIVQWLHHLNPRKLTGEIRRRGLSGTVSLALAAITCYGTLALVSLMSLLGVSLAINEGIWAGGIIFFAIIATVIIGLGKRKHHSIKPLITALIGSGILIYTMYVSYSMLSEALGFIILAIATYYDYNLRRLSGVKT